MAAEANKVIYSMVRAGKLAGRKPVLMDIVRSCPCVAGTGRFDGGGDGVPRCDAVRMTIKERLTDRGDLPR